MLGWLWKRKVKAQTKDKLRRAKKLGIKSANEMSQTSLAALIARAETKQTKGSPPHDSSK